MSIERNAAICQMYIAGATLKTCAEKYAISHERVRQILRKAGVFKHDRQIERSDRDAFLGVNLTTETKDALKAKADESGVSMSRLVSDQIDEMVK